MARPLSLSRPRGKVGTRNRLMPEGRERVKGRLKSRNR